MRSLTPSTFCPSCGFTAAADARFCPNCATPVVVPGGDPLFTRVRTAVAHEYEVLREIGRGGMAAVFLARELNPRRMVALKVMLPELAYSESMPQRFLAEAQTAASLEHPNIVTVFSSGESGGVRYFAMRYIDGASLEQLLLVGGRLPVRLACYVLAEVTRALDFAHGEEVVHRDVKPGNVMLDRRWGRAIVTDFGIAKVADGENLTRTGLAIGTPAYMSPELCIGLPPTSASDQYALGVVAYQLLTGAPPFVGNALDVQNAHVRAAPRRLREGCPECSPALEAAILRMLEKSPDARWPRLADALPALLEHVGPDAVCQDELRARLARLTQSPDFPGYDRRLHERRAGTNGTPSTASAVLEPAATPIAATPIAATPIAAMPVAAAPMALAPIAPAPIAATPVAMPPEPAVVIPPVAIPPIVVPAAALPAAAVAPVAPQPVAPAPVAPAPVAIPAVALPPVLATSVVESPIIAPPPAAAAVATPVPAPSSASAPLAADPRPYATAAPYADPAPYASPAAYADPAPYADAEAYAAIGSPGMGGRRVRPAVALAATTLTVLLLGATVYVSRGTKPTAPVTPATVALAGTAAAPPSAVVRPDVGTTAVLPDPAIVSKDASAPKSESTTVQRPKARVPKDPLAAGHVLIERHVGVPTLHVGETMPLVAWLVDKTGHVLADGPVRWSSSRPSALDVTGGVAHARHATDEPLVVTARMGNKRGELRVRVVPPADDATAAAAPAPSPAATPPSGTP